MEKIEEKWNEIFVEFLDQMNILFPQSPANSIKIKFRLSSFLGGKKPILVFMDHLRDHGDEIENENDEYFFGDTEIEFVRQLELAKYYKLADDDNKKVIWSYITTLYKLASIYDS